MFQLVPGKRTPKRTLLKLHRKMPTRLIVLEIIALRVLAMALATPETPQV